jgi:hypothetical protein
MSVYKKLNDARIVLQNTQLKKSGHNKFAGYQYFELGDFLPTINKTFSELGLCGVVSYGVDVATLTITDIDDGSQVLITSPMAEANLKGCHPIQNLGAVETYTRRYLWVTAMEIVEHDALDSSKPLDETVKPSPIKAEKPELKSPQLSDYDDETQQWLNELAVEMTKAVAEDATIDAYNSWQTLDNDQKSIMWHMLDSKTRSTIKKYIETLNLKKAA